MRSPAHVFVVDADVAGAAGPDPKTRPWSDKAREAHDVLWALWRSSGFQVAMDVKLYGEWREHAGHTAKAWLAGMASKGRIRRLDREAPTDWVVELVERHIPDENDREVALKDTHLVALAHDPGDDRILSNDRAAREKFARISDARVARIHWAHASVDTVRWLKDGAPANDALRLRAPLRG